MPGPGAKRSRYLAWLTALLAALLMAAIAGSWFLYVSVRNEMDRQLGDRLISIASTAAQSIGSDRFRELLRDGKASAQYERLRLELEGTAQANDLDNIVLVDADSRARLDLHGGAPDSLSGSDPLLDLQSELRTTILSGEPQTTRLVEVRGLSGEYLKTGYAAVEDSSGHVLGAIAVAGGSDFFSVLPGMRRKLLWSAGLGLVGVLVLGLLILRVLRSLIAYEESLRRAAALAAIGQISAIVAHEIKNPLAIIRSRSERVRAKIQSGKDPSEVLEWFEAIPAEVDRLDAILTSYLSLARPDQEGGGSCRPVAVAEETVQFLGAELTKRGIRLEREFDSGETLVAAMGARSLRQVLLNLMLNSIQAMERGGRLVLRAHRDHPWVELEVEDNGTGMTEAEMSRVLEPFFTTRPTGSGLGLTLVQSLVQARGGDLHIRSAPGQGTRVTIRLPGAEDQTNVAEGRGAKR
jgi:signal transduction histidine kinase